MSLPSIVQLAGRYQLEDKIATGGYGQVWRATDITLARPVAVKLLITDHAQHPQALARFRTEAQRAGSLCHENIARIYDYVEPAFAEPPFLVMELVDGPSVAHLLGEGPLDAAWTMHIVAGAAAGLQAAHEAGLVHRDIKPANLLFTRDWLVKVTDFGISYAVNSLPVTSTGMLLGTPGYLAPERLTGEGAAGPADLYALGIVAYECLTGAQPFIGMPIEVAVAHRDRPLPPLPGSVPADVAALIADLTAKDPAGRPAGAGEVAWRAAELRDYLVSAPVAASAPGLPGDACGPAGGAAGLAGGSFGPASGVRDEPGQGTPPLGADHGLVPGPGPGQARRFTALRGRRRAGLAAAAALALALAVAGLAAVRLAGTGSPILSTAGPGTTPGTSTAQLVEVNRATLIGQPVSTAVRHLQALGLAIRVNWRPTTRQPAGTVLAVSPGGRVAPYSLITLTGARSPAAAPGVYPATDSPPARSATPFQAQGMSASPGTSVAAPPPPSSVSPGGQTTSPSPGPTSSSGSGNGNGKGNGNGNGNGNGKGNGNGNGKGNG